MRRYETIYIIKANTTEDDINVISERTNGIIEQFNGSIIKEDRWGIKLLAYLIQKEKQGYYVYVEYAGTPEAVDEIERLFRIDEKVIKYMTIKTQEVYTPDPVPEVVEETAEEAVADSSEETVAASSEDPPPENNSEQE